MKIITKKREKEIKNMERMNDFLSNGYRAMSICLDFEKAIIGIMEQCRKDKIELPLSYFNSTKHIETCVNPATNGVIIQLKEE